MVKLIKESIFENSSVRLYRTNLTYTVIHREQKQFKSKRLCFKRIKRIRDAEKKYHWILTLIMNKID